MNRHERRARGGAFAKRTQGVSEATKSKIDSLDTKVRAFLDGLDLADDPETFSILGSMLVQNGVGLLLNTGLTVEAIVDAIEDREARPDAPPLLLFPDYLDTRGPVS